MPTYLQRWSVVTTYTTTESFRRDLRDLTVAQRAAFRRAVEHFVEDLLAGQMDDRGARDMCPDGRRDRGTTPMLIGISGPSEPGRLRHPLPIGG